MDKTIHDEGKYVGVRYKTNSQCSYCTIDPISGDGRYNCSTCNGTGIVSVATTASVKAIVNTFSGGSGFIRFANDKLGLLPYGHIRITVWLDDIRRTKYSNISPTYLDSAESIILGGKKYAVKDYNYIGIDEEDLVCVMTCERMYN